MLHLLNRDPIRACDSITVHFLSMLLFKRDRFLNRQVMNTLMMSLILMILELKNKQVADHLIGRNIQ